MEHPYPGLSEKPTATIFASGLNGFSLTVSKSITTIDPDGKLFSLLISSAAVLYSSQYSLSSLYWIALGPPGFSPVTIHPRLVKSLEKSSLNFGCLSSILGCMIGK